MTPLSIQKERLTMASTGRKRFWLGVVAGGQSGRTVPLDTIILQKLVIHNLKLGHRDHRQTYCVPFFYYATPGLIADQIRRHDPGSPERIELLAILEVYQEILEAPPYDWEQRRTYTRRALQEYSASSHIIEFQLKNQLEALQKDYRE